MSLRRQFALALVAFALLLTALGGWATWRVASDALEAEMDDKLRQVAGAAVAVRFRTGGYSALLEPGAGNSDFARRTQAQLQSLGTYVQEAWLFRMEDLRSVASSRPDEFPIGTVLSNFEAYRDEISRASVEGTATTPLFPGLDGQPYKYGFAAIRADTAIALAVRMPVDYLEPLARLQSRIFIASVGAVVLALILAAVLAANVAVPLERLSRAALRIQRGRWSEPVEAERGREIGRLSRAMERMRTGILRRDEQLRLMLAQVAHEIRNPLGGLELFAAAAQESEDPDETDRILGRIRDEVETLNVIINDFLAFARPLEPQIKIHDVRDPVRAAAELVSMEMGNDRRRVRVDLPDEPLMARADPAHVKRVTLNLLRNASQAGENVEVQVVPHHGEVMITVRDDGPGIPGELRERIFEPFVTDKEQGAGLGLAIVHKVVHENGGRVELTDPEESSVGNGAEFKVYFSSSDELPPPVRLAEDMDS